MLCLVFLLINCCDNFRNETVKQLKDRHLEPKLEFHTSNAPHSENISLSDYPYCTSAISAVETETQSLMNRRTDGNDQTSKDLA